MLLALGVAAVSLVRSGYYITPEEFAQKQSESTITLALPTEFYPAVKLARMQLDAPEIVVLGASRGTIFREGMFKPYRFYNASSTCWTFEKMAEMLKTLGGDRPPRVVIINLDYFAFSEGYAAYWRAREKAAPLHLPTVAKAKYAMRRLWDDVKTRPQPTLRHILSGAERLYPLSNAKAWNLRSDGSVYFPPNESEMSSADPQRLRHVYMLEKGAGRRIDPRQLERLAEVCKVAQQRGITLVGIQMPYPQAALEVLDAGVDFVDRNVRCLGADNALWRDFEAAETAQRFQEMGILYFDFARHAEPGGAQCFSDFLHPSERLYLSTLVTALKDPRLHALLPAIDLGLLEDTLAGARSQGLCDGMFGE